MSTPSRQEQSAAYAAGQYPQPKVETQPVVEAEAKPAKKAAKKTTAKKG